MSDKLTPEEIKAITFGDNAPVTRKELGDLLERMLEATTAATLLAAKQHILLEVADLAQAHAHPVGAEACTALADFAQAVRKASDAAGAQLAQLKAAFEQEVKT